MHKNLYKLTYLCLLGLLFSCSPTKESVSGVYIFINKRNTEFSEAVHLYKNGTYNYHFQFSMIPEPRLHGVWQLKGHTITLCQSNVVVDTTWLKGVRDTFEIKKLNYKLRWGNLKRYIHSRNEHRVLKKQRKPFKTFILNGEPF
jgi:hypothetical protein